MTTLSRIRSLLGFRRRHVYLSTSCFHGEHVYCRSHTGLSGTKTPARCKFCASPCICRCHIST